MTGTEGKLEMEAGEWEVRWEAGGAGESQQRDPSCGGTVLLVQRTKAPQQGADLLLTLCGRKLRGPLVNWRNDVSWTNVMTSIQFCHLKYSIYLKAIP